MKYNLLSIFTFLIHHLAHLTPIRIEWKAFRPPNRFIIILIRIIEKRKCYFSRPVRLLLAFQTTYAFMFSL